MVGVSRNVGVMVHITYSVPGPGAAPTTVRVAQLRVSGRSEWNVGVMVGITYSITYSVPGPGPRSDGAW